MLSDSGPALLPDFGSRGDSSDVQAAAVSARHSTDLHGSYQMFKTLTAATLSISLATASLAPSPASAGNRENVAPILLGLGALAIAAAAMHDRDKDKKKKKKKHRPAPPVTRAQPAPVVQAPPPPPPAVQVTRPREAVIVKPARSKRTLPQECARSFDLHNGSRTFLMKRCLINEGVRISKLPDRCEREIELRGGRRTLTGWKRSCLKREGFNIR